MQRKNYDSDFCGSVPMHFINQVQPYGMLLVVAIKDLTIIQVSQNVEEVLGIAAEEITNNTLDGFVPEHQVKDLTTKFAGKIDKLPLQFTFNVNGKEKNFLSVTHAKDGYYILELEETTGHTGNDNSFISVYQEIKYATVAINAAGTIKEVCETAINELKRISGFDKIMVYKFDEEWNGTVIAEIMEEGMESYLGLCFPASDIPKQARALYHLNPYRQIPDCGYTPVKLYPVINPITYSFTDLSECNMRGVPAVHTEYLKNMGVTASMSTRIIKDDRLWGLISCHHRTAKFLNYELCSVFELLSGILSAKFSSLQNTEEYRQANELRNVYTDLVEELYSKDDLVTGLTKGNVTILDLLRAKGAVITYGKQIETIGNVPDADAIRDLLLWIESNKITKLFVTNSLSAEYEEAAKMVTVASGMIVLPIHAGKGEYVIGFRPEVLQQVKWGGNPDEAISFEEDKKAYHPRNSFRLWQETLKHNSLPWSEQELTTAENFRSVLVEYTLKHIYA